MITLGHFTAVEDGYLGRLRTLGLDAELRVVAAPGGGEKQPTHRVFAGEAECGAAWPSASEAAVLNLQLDDPAWAEPVRARLVHGPGEDFLLVWRRPSPE